MGQTTDEIEAHIKDTHQDLSSNLRTLEQKVKAVTDWKQQFRTNPMTMIGVAFGGGIALAAMFGRRRYPRRERPASWPVPANGSHVVAQHGKLMDSFDQIKDALIGVAAARVADLIGGYVPGFQEHFPQPVKLRSEPPRQTAN